MESARGHYEINVRNTGDHISDFDSGRRNGVCVGIVGRSDFIHIVLPMPQSEEYLHVTRHTTQ